MIAIYERFSLLINLILFVKITSTGKSKADCQILFELVVVFSEVVAATILWMLKVASVKYIVLLRASFCM